MKNKISIARQTIGEGCPVFIIAELSANHRGSLESAKELIRAAKDTGADAVKIQTYTADTITLDSDSEPFRIGKGTIWEGRTLHELYDEAHTPWEWHAPLKEEAEKLDLPLFSTPYDFSAVDFLETLEMPVYKIASFELVDLPLIERAARTGKPLLMSTGMASLEEIEEAVKTARQAGCEELLLFKCTSAYPALPEEMNLKTIPDLAEKFNLPVGISDHTLDIAVPVSAVTLGAKAIEKHLTLSRKDGGADSAFSLEPKEFEAMVNAVRTTEKALGAARYEPTEKEQASRVFRKSIFVAKDIKKGEPFTEANLRVVRPSHGLHPRHWKEFLGQKAARDLKKGQPLTQDMAEGTRK